MHMCTTTDSNVWGSEHFVRTPQQCVFSQDIFFQDTFFQEMPVWFSKHLGRFMAQEQEAEPIGQTAKRRRKLQWSDNELLNQVIRHKGCDPCCDVQLRLTMATACKRYMGNLLYRNMFFQFSMFCHSRYFFKVHFFKFSPHPEVCCGLTMVKFPPSVITSRHCICLATRTLTFGSTCTQMAGQSCLPIQLQRSLWPCKSSTRSTWMILSMFSSLFPISFYCFSSLFPICFHDFPVCFQFALQLSMEPTRVVNPGPTSMRLRYSPASLKAYSSIHVGELSFTTRLQMSCIGSRVSNWRSCAFSPAKKNSNMRFLT